MSETALTVSSPKELMTFLNRSKTAIEMALPKHLNPDRMVRLALTCFSTTPALRECSAQSILASIVVASQLGLEPGIAGQGYLIPYKGKCTFVPGWQGLVGLLNNTGRATAWTGAVFEGDEWEYELGSNPKCKHVPGANYGDPDKLIYFYACGKVNGSEQPVIEAWPIERVIKHRDKYNKVGSKHYSFGNFEMYARKVVLLQVLKYMPRSIELNNAITAADAAEVGHSTRVDGGVVVDVDSAVEPAEAVHSPPAPHNVPSAAPAPAAATPELESDDVPMSGKTPLAAKGGTPQAELEAFVIEGGCTFNHFQKWGEESGNLPDASSVSSFSEVPAEIAKRLMKAKVGLLFGLKRIAGK